MFTILYAENSRSVLNLLLFIESRLQESSELPMLLSLNKTLNNFQDGKVQLVQIEIFKMFMCFRKMDRPYDTS